MDIDKVYTLQKQSQTLYSQVKLKNFLKNTKKDKYLRFGFICPGAVGTIKYLSSKKSVNPEILTKIKKLTDFQFFVEIYQIYKEFLDPIVYNKMKKILGRKSCAISSVITDEITNLFSQLNKNIQKNIPDNFYHIRHNTLICSKDKDLVKKRIEILRNMEGFTSGCLGRRDGVSGCRTCCSNNYPDNYNLCVTNCMKY